MFSVDADLIQLDGTVVIGSGGLPSARIGDMVLTGPATGYIITGQTNLIH